MFTESKLAEKKIFKNLRDMQIQIHNYSFIFLEIDSTLAAYFFFLFFQRDRKHPIHFVYFF